MSTPSELLETHTSNVDESMGVRRSQIQPRLAPIANGKDVGRKPLREFGTLDVTQVIADPDQPRAEFSDDDLARLAQSLRRTGQLSPIRVRWCEPQQKWMIVCGERRWRAAQRAGMKTIRCQFLDQDLASTEVLEQQLIENCLRADLAPLEQAKAFAVLMETNSWTGKQLAAQLHLAPATVSRALALLKLPAEVQSRVAVGELSARSAYELSQLKSPQTQKKLATAAANKGLSSSATQRAVRQHKGKRVAKTKHGSRQVFFADGGWRVVVSATKKGNYHEMEAALVQALEEVRHYIANGRQLS